MMPPTFKLIRLVDEAGGVFGVMIFERQIFAVTLERLYVGPGSPNAHLAKIPSGITYRALRSHYFKGGYDTYEVQVPGHDRILVHKANYITDLDGCIGIAESYHEFGGVFGARPGIADSSSAFDEFMRLCAGAPEIAIVVVDLVDQVAA